MKHLKFSGLLLCFLLAACGGGSGTGGTSVPLVPVNNTAPVANAGASQTLVVNTLVSLDGRASADANGDALTYSWTLRSQPAGSTATLSACCMAATSSE